MNRWRLFIDSFWMELSPLFLPEEEHSHSPLPIQSDIGDTHSEVHSLSLDVD